MPGEDLEAALAAGRALRDAGLGCVLTCLGEDLEDRDEAARVTRHYLEALGRLRAEGLEGEVSVKLTQLGLLLDPEGCEAHLASLIGRAGEVGTWIWIDMESSATTDATLEIYRRARGRFANVGVCLQAYLYRTEQDLDALVPLRPGVRLVKGAYREPPAKAFPRKQDVDANYLRLSGRLLELQARGSVTRAIFGTHDGALIRLVEAAARAAGIGAGDLEFQMLYGIRRDEQVRLAAAGHRVRVLISYGDAWFPWYMRRLAERPANVLFALKSLLSH
jgi:proline dehydrogenase